MKHTNRYVESKKDINLLFVHTYVHLYIISVDISVSQTVSSKKNIK